MKWLVCELGSCAAPSRHGASWLVCELCVQGRHDGASRMQPHCVISACSCASLCASFACKVATTARAGCSPSRHERPTLRDRAARGSQSCSWVTEQPSGIGPLAGHGSLSPVFFSASSRPRLPSARRCGVALGFSFLSSEKKPSFACAPPQGKLLFPGEALRRRPEASFFPRRGAAASPWLQLSWRRRVSPRDDVPPHSLEEAFLSAPLAAPLATRRRRRRLGSWAWSVSSLEATQACVCGG